jgi:heme exporter protein C
MAEASQCPGPKALVALGALLLCIGSYWGLAKAPAEVFMGDVQRIMYVHVPTAWNAMLALTFAFVCAVFFLFTNSWKWDNRLEAAMEVGVVLSLLLCTQGAIWAKPTWGVWWDWDPRLTSSTVMLLSFIGVMLLRSIVRDPDRRATWSAVSTVLAGVNVPIVYESVKWWRSLHQIQSEMMGQSKIDPEMRGILYFNVFAFLFGSVWFMARRYRLAERRAEQEMPEPLPAVGVASGGVP